MNIIIPQDNITSELFVVQWDEVDDIFPITYIVRWYGEDGIDNTTTVNEPMYTVTGLTANTSYNVTIFVINTCCGAGPVSNVFMVMTNLRPTTPLGNIVFSFYDVTNFILSMCVHTWTCVCVYAHMCMCVLHMYFRTYYNIIYMH